MPVSDVAVYRATKKNSFAGAGSLIRAMLYNRNTARSRKSQHSCDG